MQPKYNSEWQCNDQYIDEDLNGTTSHPKDVVIKAVPWVVKTVDPGPFDRPAIQQVGYCAADPESHDHCAHHKDLEAERGRDGEQPVVHE